MSVEALVFAALRTLVADRVYPDIAPAASALPRITYQQAGGYGQNYIAAETVGKRNARMQVNVWAASRTAAANLSRQVEDVLKTTVALNTKILGAAVAIYEPDTKLYGTHQDFSFYY